MSDKGKSKETSRGKGSSSSGGGGGKDRDKKNESRLADTMNKISSWLSTSEPSAHALKQHRKNAFQKAGISPSDVDANAKLHAPIGTIPEDAIKPAAGPSPEEVVKEKKKKKMRKAAAAAATARENQSNGWRQGSAASGSGSASFSGGSSSIQTPSISVYSSSMSGPDAGGSMYATGDDDFGANGWGPRQ